MYGDGVSLEWITILRNDYGIILDRATTYKSDYDVSPKISTKYTNGYGMFSDLTTHNMYDYKYVWYHRSRCFRRGNKCERKLEDQTLLG